MGPFCFSHTHPCTAYSSFAGVAERGSWVKQLTRAYNEYKKGDMDGALIDYIYLAELGYVHLHADSL